jgi:hypothetical protein
MIELSEMEVVLLIIGWLVLITYSAIKFIIWNTKKLMNEKSVPEIFEEMKRELKLKEEFSNILEGLK